MTAEPVLVVGLGSVGGRHVRNLRRLIPGVRVVAYREERQRPADDLIGSWLVEYTDLKQALAQQPVAAIVCNPTSLHLAVALPAARAGCHLFIEKPLSHSLEGLDELSRIIREQPLVAMVGFQFRFHPGLRTVKQLLDEGAVGRVVHALAHWGEYLPGWHPWEDYRRSYSARADLGGGAILTLCHPLDYLHWLLGTVRAVTATTGRISGLELDVEDTADVTLQFVSGAMGTVHLDYVQRPPSHWLQITGTTGTIRWDNADGTVHCYRADRGEWERIPAPAEFERNTMFLDEMRHFLDCTAGRAEPLVTLDDGIRALEVALAAKLSAAEGRVVEV